MYDRLKSTRFTVFLIVLLDIMGLGLIIPSQPFLAKSFGAHPGTITLLGTVYSLMQFGLSPVWGSLSDRFGRRPILLCTILLTFIGHCAFALSSTLLMLFVARAAAGIGAANISTAQAVLSDTHPAAERSRAMALIGAAFGLGFVFGPALGGLLFQLDHRAPAGFAALLSALNMVLVYFTLAETRPALIEHKRGDLSFLKFLQSDGSLRQLLLTTLLTMTAFALMEHSVGLFIESVWVPANNPDSMTKATTLTSIFMVVVGISAVFVQGFLVRRWLKTTSETKLFRFGLITIAFGLILIPSLGWVGSYPLFLISGAFLALGSGMFNPSMAGLVSLACPANRQGLGLAMNQSASALGRIIGPTFAGILFLSGVQMPFIVGGLLTCLALGLSTRIKVSR